MQASSSVCPLQKPRKWTSKHLETARIKVIGNVTAEKLFREYVPDVGDLDIFMTMAFTSHKLTRFIYWKIRMYCHRLLASKPQTSCRWQLIQHVRQETLERHEYALFRIPKRVNTFVPYERAIGSKWRRSCLFPGQASTQLTHTLASRENYCRQWDVRIETYTHIYRVVRLSDQNGYISNEQRIAESKEDARCEDYL